MINTGKCPKCDATVNNVKTEHVLIGTPPDKQWHGISYVCTSCRTVLGIQIDPVSLMNDTVDKLCARLKGR